MKTAALLKNTNCPRPIRFEDGDEAVLRRLKELTGLSVSSIIRRAVQYAAPRFLNGRVNLLTLKEEPHGTPLTLSGEGASGKSEI